jgi:hypothetical protein
LPLLKAIRLWHTQKAGARRTRVNEPSSEERPINVTTVLPLR